MTANVARRKKYSKTMLSNFSSKYNSVFFEAARREIYDIYNVSPDVVTLILEYGAYDPLEHTFRNAALRGNIVVMKYLYDTAAPDDFLYFNQDLFLDACMGGNVDLVYFILSKVIILNLREQVSAVFMMIAKREDLEPVARLIIRLTNTLDDYAITEICAPDVAIGILRAVVEKIALSPYEITYAIERGIDLERARIMCEHCTNPDFSFWLKCCLMCTFSRPIFGYILSRCTITDALISSIVLDCRDIEAIEECVEQGIVFREEHLTMLLMSDCYAFSFECLERLIELIGRPFSRAFVAKVFLGAQYIEPLYFVLETLSEESLNDIADILYMCAIGAGSQEKADILLEMVQSEEVVNSILESAARLNFDQ